MAQFVAQVAACLRERRRRFPSRTSGWRIVDNAAFGAVQVVVTPAAVLAIATRDQLQASLGAKAVERCLRSRGLHHGVAVVAVLMRGRPAAGYHVIDDVYVVDARRPQAWLPLFAAPVLPDELRADIAAALGDSAPSSAVAAGTAG